MKTIDLIEEKLNLEALLNLARKEPVVLLTADGKEFVLAEADDFEREVEALRGSQAFQRFLEEKTKSASRVSLEEIEAEIDKEIAAQRKPT
jgi:PHD/YefM family antitoxin component YafN of YafNO toxin-antitoxin module